MAGPTVYVETSILKGAASAIPKLQWVSTGTKYWGNQIPVDTGYAESVTINPNDRLPDNASKAEAALLPDIADAAKNGHISLITHFETLLESRGLPRMNSLTGLFYEAPIEQREAPIRYKRTISSGFQSTRSRRYQFLTSLTNSRFLELQRACGAYQGANPPHGNQLMDAFQIWCAEHNQADFFLTLDRKLKRSCARTRHYRTNVEIVLPSELIAAIKWGN